jgi:hypothetical protein
MEINKQFAFNTVSILIGIFGVFLAIYFNSQSTKEREPTYYVHPERVKIVDTERAQSGEIEVIFKGEPIRKSNITAVKIYFWNSGGMHISKNDILEQLYFEFPKSVNLIEAIVTSQTRQVVNFKIHNINLNQTNIIPVDFDILEKNDGVSIQAIFSGPPDSEIKLKGTIVEAGNPKHLDSPELQKYYKNQSPIARIEKARASSFISFGAMSSFSVLLIIFYLIRRKNKDETKRKKAKLYILIAAMYLITAIGLSGYQYYEVQKALSPGVPYKLWLESQ